MSDIWSLMQWWDDWQLRVLVLGSLSLQWFLLLAAPMRKYSVPHLFRTCIWLAYISSDAVAIYALATLFNRHARTVPASYCPTPPAGKEQSRILEVLWAPILLIHLGGQEEMTAYEIEDNELWRRHTVTVVSQVTVALYAFYKSWQPSSSDVKLTASAVLLFIIGVVSFSEKPLALNRAKIKRLADVSAMIQGTKNRTVLIESLMHVSLFEESNPFGLLKQRNSTTTGLLGRAWCFRRNGDRRKEKKGVAMSAGDKVLMVLSDMSLLAAAKELVERKKAEKVEDVLPPILFASDDEQPRLQQWLRGAFAFIYTKASVMVSPIYLVYHLALVPVLHVAALTLFATSDKRRYRRTDVKITYIILCLTAALDFLAVFVRLLVYQFMSMTKVPPLCETLPSYSLIDEAVREGDPYIGWVYKFARSTIGWTCNRPRHRELYQEVEATVLADLVDGSQDRDLASYRIFDSSTTDNWALSKELQASCGQEIRANLGISFDRSVLLWHIATDLCFRCSEVVVHDDDDDDDDDEQDGEEAAPGEGEGGGGEGEGGGGGGEGEGEEIELEDGGARHRSKANAELRLHIKCTEAISSYMGHLLNSNPEMLMTGSRHHLISESRKGVQSTILKNRAIRNWLASGGCGLSCSCASTGSSCICGQMNRSHHFSQPKEQLKKFVSEMADRRVNFAKNSKDFQIITACRLAKELMEIQDDSTRWKLMYKVWIGMLCYSASMCRGYLHAKSLGEGGEFLSFVWLVLSLKGAQTLADKLQLPPKPTTKPL